MENQVTNNPHALPLFFTEEVFLIADKQFSDANQMGEALLENIEVLTPPKKQTVANEAYIAPLETENVGDEPKVLREFSYLGGNKKGILILVYDNDNEVSTEIGNTLLKNILKAIRLKKDDFALLNMAKQHPAKFTDLNAFFKPKVILAFGIDSALLDLGQFDLGEMFTKNDVNVILGRNLSEFDDTDKKALWRNLQGCTF
ncbi:hypothetical protein ACVWYG_000838 [Pedobacter sp. UYEF25]